MQVVQDSFWYRAVSNFLQGSDWGCSGSKCLYRQTYALSALTVPMPLVRCYPLLYFQTADLGAPNTRVLHFC
jgi:hypothetical protein